MATGVESEQEEERAAVTLTRELVSAHLGVLGRDPFSQAHVFTTASLAELSLADVEALREFPHVQHLVCRRNRLTSLAPLQHLPVLLSLDASDNELACVLDYEVPKCSRGNAWEGGARWVGSLLRRAELSGNRIAQLPRCVARSHPFLTELRLARNDIHDISGLARLRFLRVLDLSHNHLTSTRGLVDLADGEREDAADAEEDGEDGVVRALPALETLLIAHNAVTSVEGVAQLPRLQHLDASSNPLARLDELRDCRRLQRLELRDCAVTNVNELNTLVSLPLLGELALSGSPLAATQGGFYRARVLVRLRQLRLLDGELATAREKVKARAMHGQERDSRRAVAAKHLPTLEFIDYLPPLEFEDDEQLQQLLQTSEQCA